MLRRAGGAGLGPTWLAPISRALRLFRAAAQAEGAREGGARRGLHMDAAREGGARPPRGPRARVGGARPTLGPRAPAGGVRPPRGPRAPAGGARPPPGPDRLSGGTVLGGAGLCQDI